MGVSTRGQGWIPYSRGKCATGIALFAAVVSRVFAADPFSIVILPDTQFYTSGNSNMQRRFWSQVDFIVSNRATLNIQLVLHEGDVTDSNTPPEWVVASNCMSRLDTAGIPYAVVVGNHDMETNGAANTRETLLNTYFTWEAATSKWYWGGAFVTGRLENAFYRLNMGGVDWLVLALEFGPRDCVLEWANQVIESYPDHRVVVLIHAHLAEDGALIGSAPQHEAAPSMYALEPRSEGVPRDGPQVWEYCLRRHPSVAFVFCGHARAPTGGKTCIMTNDYGAPVYQLLANYQHFNGGDGYLRIMRFDPDQNQVSVFTYSPFKQQHLTDPDNAFTLRQVRVFDTTPPTPPTHWAATVRSARRIAVKWAPATDAESGIASYIVNLNGQPSGIARTNRFTLTGLSESQSYTVTVAAVNGGGLRSPPAGPIVITTPPDTNPPAIRNVFARGNKVRIWFSEPLDPGTATQSRFYRISDDVEVGAAVWNGASNAVTLFVHNLVPHQRYILTVDGVADASNARNVASNLTRRFIAQPAFLWEEFERGTFSGWAVVDEGDQAGPSEWFVTNGALRQTSNIYGSDTASLTNRRGTYVYWDSPEARGWSQYVFQVRIRTQDDDGIGILFHCKSASNYCKVDFDSQRWLRAAYEVVNGEENVPALYTNRRPYIPNTDLLLVVRVDGNVIEADLNGLPLFDGPVTTTVQNAGTIGLYCWGSAGVDFSDILVVPPNAVEAEETDSDGDGLDDRWERTILGRDESLGETIDDIRPDDDLDGGGQRNAEEFLAGTDAGDPGDFFRCGISGDGGAMHVEWRATSNRAFHVWHAAALTEAFSNMAGPLLSGDWPILPDRPAGFFCVSVQSHP